jgi:ComF family protein
MAAVPQRLGSTRSAWRYALRQGVWATVDVIFPPRCGGCGQAGYRFCPNCLTSLQYLSPPVCNYCGGPLERGQASNLCASCRRVASDSLRSAALAGIRSAAFFEGPLQQAFHHLKYKRDIILADALARMLFEAWRTHAVPGDAVVPVPLSAQRLRERGYNQAALLARGFAELAGLAYIPKAAARVRHTASQVGLSAEARQANVAGAFAGRAGQAAGRAIILVDDVRTTGATLEACAQALRAAGAAQVWGLTLAHVR